MKKIIFTILLLIGSFLSSLLSTTIVISISSLYDLEFITQFSFIQILGILLIFSFIKFNPKISEEKEYSKTLSDGFTLLLQKVFFSLFVWGIAFAYYYITKL